MADSTWPGRPTCQRAVAPRLSRRQSASARWRRRERVAVLDARRASASNSSKRTLRREPAARQAPGRPRRRGRGSTRRASPASIQIARIERSAATPVGRSAPSGRDPSAASAPRRPGRARRRRVERQADRPVGVGGVAGGHRLALDERGVVGPGHRRAAPEVGPELLERAVVAVAQRPGALGELGQVARPRRERRRRGSPGRRTGPAGASA